MFDRRKKAIYARGPKALFHDAFDRFDPEGAERRWQQVEEKMPAVYRLIDERRVLENQDAVQTLRDLLAVHWVSTPAMRQIHDRMKGEVGVRNIAELRDNPVLLASLLKQKTGLIAAGQAELDWINERQHREFLIDNAEQIFIDSLATSYAKARAILSKGHVQIGYAKNFDLLIGDAPVITVMQGHEGGVGPHQGVALGDATEICMPISPKILIGLGPEPASGTLDENLVHQHNRRQITGFVRWIGCQPEGPSDRAMRRDAPADIARL